MNFVRPVRDRVRTLLNIRVRRAVGCTGVRPALGARICREDVRMTVQAGLSDALWRWLQSQGWREITYRPDRRRYRDVPPAYVTRLIDASIEERERVLNAAVANAVLRPAGKHRAAWTGRRA